MANVAGAEASRLTSMTSTKTFSPKVKQITIKNNMNPLIFESMKAAEEATGISLSLGTLTETA